MNTKTLLCVMTVAAIVLGCAAPQPRMLGARHCPPSLCEAVVTIDESSGTPTVKIDADPLITVKRDGPVILWRLDAPEKFIFCKDSIAPHTTAPTGSKMTTTQPQWDAQIDYLTHSAKRFLVRDKNQPPSSPTVPPLKLFYDIKVYDTTCSGPSYKLDPAIFNDF